MTFLTKGESAFITASLVVGAVVLTAIAASVPFVLVAVVYYFLKGVGVL